MSGAEYSSSTHPSAGHGCLVATMPSGSLLLVILASILASTLSSVWKSKMWCSLARPMGWPGCSQSSLQRHPCHSRPTCLAGKGYSVHKATSNFCRHCQETDTANHLARLRLILAARRFDMSARPSKQRSYQRVFASNWHW
ncbi:hypothetical protein HDK90DRAFT_321797 [Phyllosticta capitalensis]|uniref:Uncharacterized protein n=1 Tax=Phyllosticta capitalensis TaxID=121624 RepID=A0ABR1YIW3_9PEZI